MVSGLLAGLWLFAGQAPAMPETGSARPALECAEHVTDWRARRGCLVDLLETAADALDSAAEDAREEAAETDMDSGGMFRAEASFEAAQSAWLAYRDAECDRRAALMFLSAESREEIALDCRIALTRARAQELREN